MPWLLPPAGSHWRRPATTSTSTMATQKVGSDCPSAAITCAVRSSPVPFFTAARIPRGKAMESEIPMAKAARRREFGRRPPVELASGPRGRPGAVGVAEGPRDGAAHEGEVLLDVGAVQAEVVAGLGILFRGRRHGEDE